MSRPFPISLVMIVRDEEATLGRCLASVAGLVDEMVVVDTGSSDDTVAIARSYGANVSHFDWVDDFAAARNFSLSEATHPWRLVLDADQWIIDPGAALAVLDRLGCTEPAFIGMVDTFEAGEHEKLNTDVVPFREARIVPHGVRYTGRVHEQPTPQDRFEHVPVTIGHDGYRPDALARKEGRNATLLAAAIEDDPADPYLWYQLGCEHVVRRGHAAGLPYLVQAYNLLHPETDAALPVEARDIELRTWSPRLVQRLLLALTATGRHEEAVALGEIESPIWPDSADFHYVYGRAQRALALSLLDSDEPRAAQLVASSRRLWERAVELGDRREYAGVLAQRATVLAARMVADDYETLGRTAEAARYRAIA